jgi:BirA family biotin operon repressor/biotin-[acetyl-CoA-carboxylase] ligase
MDKIDIREIKKNLAAEIIGRKLICLETVDSTNTYASGIIKGSNSILGSSEYNGIVVISETQSGGRGRLDRKWFSPAGGIWMTIILQPELELQDLSKMTLLAAAAIIEALVKNYKISLNVKWPNDIYFNEKKLSGILAESEKINDTTYLITGIGINANNDFTGSRDECLNAVSLTEITGNQINRNFLTAEILNEFEILYNYYLKTQDFKRIFKKIEDIMIY